MTEKKQKDYGYRPLPREERGYQPTMEGTIPRKPQGGYKPETDHREPSTPKQPPKKP